MPGCLRASLLPQRRAHGQAHALCVGDCAGEDLTHYKQEIPYSAEVVVEAYEDSPDITRIRAEIHGPRITKAHRGGRPRPNVKRVGMDARKDIEPSSAKVFLDLYVRVDKNWRDDERKLKRFGYMD